MEPVTQIHPQQGQPESPLESPEVLTINALLHSGEFRPEKYGLHKDMLEGWTKAWQFCVDHQEQTGEPPSVALFARSFPDFEILTGVKPEWAADRLRQAHHERTLRRRLMGAIASMNEGDLDGAREAIAEAAKPTYLARPKGMSVYDAASVDEMAMVAGFPMPYTRLQAETKGLRLGELWYLAARLGQGKSWLLPLYAVCMAEAGAHVGILSLEMPKKVYVRRVQQHMARGDAKLRAQLRSADSKTRKEALTRLPKMAGTIDVFDPGDVRMTTRAIEVVAADHNVILVDHAGLMMDGAGKKAIEDWRTMALISNTLKEQTLALNIGILAAAQVNREGESAGYTPPKLSQLAQSDALGQDADVAITLRRMGQRAMAHYLAKNRNGENDKWYSRFLPGEADFSEITKDQALDSARLDEDRLGDA